MTENLAKNASLQFGGGGSPESADPNAQPDKQGGGASQVVEQQQVPQYVTMEQVQEILTRELTRFRDSVTDRTAHRVQKILQQAQQKGVTLDPDQARAVLSVLDEEQQGQETQVQSHGKQPEQQSPVVSSDQARPNQDQRLGGEQQPVEVHPVILAADAMMQKSGVYIDPEDPELSLIDQETTDEITFLTSVRAAIQAKQQRLAAAGSPARMPNMSGAAKPGNPVANITDPDELWRMAMQKGR